ncbi:MAG: lcp 1 [Panacagrimonas sp.]|jgi:hypothetical protein|nr:oxygenase MpaB family protein [Panacagrimonas sp.]MCC2655655.1 lcp 1 [Panacagrimonas sp.]
MGSASPIEGFVPSRHRASPDVQRMLGLLHRFMPGVRPPSSELWERMGRDFMRGDEPVDRLVEWMAATGMRETRALFEQALERGIDAVGDAPAPLREFFSGIDALPAWLDRDKVELGAELHRRGGVAGTYGGRDVALVGGYQASAFNKTLLLTGALEKGPARRFAETLRWALDTTAANGMDRFEAGFKSTVRVRLIHGLVRRHVQRLPAWRMEEWGLPINQPDMAATLLGALVVPLLVARVMGMVQTREERNAAVHHARYVGWLMGVEEIWLPNDETEAMTLLTQILLSIANPDESSAQMALPMVDEPLGRPYRRFAAIRRRLDRSKHLSISRLFLGRRGMRNLGLPQGVVPWYPLLVMPFNLAYHVATRFLPGGKARAARRGRRAQERFLALLSGDQAATVGGMATSTVHAGH